MAYPAQTRELDEDEDDQPLVRSNCDADSEDEDDKPLVQSTSIKEPVGERRESAAIRRVPTPLRRRKGPPVWRDPSATLEQDVSGNLRERSEEGNPDGKALRSITNKLSDVRNLKYLHLEHYHMKTAQFKKRAIYLDILLQVDEAET